MAVWEKKKLLPSGASTWITRKHVAKYKNLHLNIK
jgi:hypothetical protein